MKRILTGVAVGLILSVSFPAAAQEIATVSLERVGPAPTRPALLLPLYAATIALQAYDGYSTLAALRGGHVELNPVVGSMTARPAVFIAVKAATAAWSIYAAERLWKSGHRGQALATLAISNGIMAAVAMNNARILGSGR
jgi:hypothetical protein